MTVVRATLLLQDHAFFVRKNNDDEDDDDMVGWCVFMFFLYKYCMLIALMTNEI